MSDAPHSDEQQTGESDKGEQAATAAEGDARPSSSSSPSSPLGRTPVLLLTNYTLRACDRYACAISINDAYKPVDHWQWMATLWRGVPGPDITIYVDEIDTAAVQGAGGAATEAVDRAVASEKEKIGTVDKVGSDKEESGLKCLVVHKEKGKEVEEKALRRLGFELGEWVRAVRR